MSRQGDPGAPLSAVQLQVLGWVADGMSVPEIAAKHHYSQDTLKSHLVRIYRQLGARNAAHAVHLAHQRGLLGETAELEQVRSERDRFRIAWRRARTRALTAGGAADRYAKRAHELQAAAMGAIGGEFLDLIAELTAPACKTDAYGNCATHGVLALEPGAQCPHVIARALLELIRPSETPA